MSKRAPQDNQPSSSGDDSSGVSVFRRALGVETPYSRVEDVCLTCGDLRDECAVAEFNNAELVYNISAERLTSVSIEVSGYVWNEDGSGQRYSARYQRDAPDSSPFDAFEKYAAQLRYQCGTVSTEEDEIAFEPSAEPKYKERKVEWAEVPSPDQLRIVEAELVRNPEHGKYRLQEIDGWEDARSVLKYNTSAFQHEEN